MSRISEMPNSKPERRKIGRPRISEGHQKTRIVPVRFKAGDLEKISHAAQAKNQTVSEWIRSTLAPAMETI